MNWIIYASLSVIKLLIVSGLILLTVLVLPVIFMMFSLGMALSCLRDLEPRLYAGDRSKDVYAYLDHFKSTWTFLSTHMVTWFHHTLITRDKTVS